MWSTIGRATARQACVGGRLPMHSATHLAAHFPPRAALVVPTGFRVAAIFAKGYGQALSRSKKTSETATPAKSSSEKKAGAKKAAAKKPAAKKATKPKAPAAEKPKKAGRAKKPLTEEQKTKLKIAELRKKALLREEPTKLPGHAWLAFMNERVRQLAQKADGPKIKVNEVTPTIALEYKALPAEEREKFQALAEQNKVANEVNYRNWVDSYTVRQIREANLARHALRRKYSLTIRSLIHDPRFPQRPISGWTAYYKARYHAPEFDGLFSRDRLSKIAAEWKQLGPEERKPFVEMGATDSDRFNKEMAVYRKEGVATP